MKKVLLSILFFLTFDCLAEAQELNARVIINREQVSNTKSGVFEALEKQITQFLNERTWTELKFRETERIQCAFNLTISTYSETDNSFKATLLVASNRPVWGSSYTTTVWNYTDKDFNFNFQEFDQLEWRPEQIDNNLTRVVFSLLTNIFAVAQRATATAGAHVGHAGSIEGCLDFISHIPLGTKSCVVDA